MKSLRLILSSKRYFAVVWVFCSLNIMIGTWVLYIPHVKAKLQLDDAELGFALFCLALGILTFLPLVPILTKKVGLGKTTLFGIILFSIAFSFPIITPNYILFCTSLFIVGMFSGCTDIAMNALVSQLEQEDNQHFMSAAHGFFSLGGVLGGAIGTFFLLSLLEPFYHMVLITVILIVSNLFWSKYYVFINETETKTESSKQERTSYLKLFKPLLVLAIIAFIVMGSEGAIEHWSSLYINEVIRVSDENLTGLGFVLFSIAMTIGRFFGDGISKSFGSMKTMLYGCLLATIGFLLVLTAKLTLSIIGFGIVGLGLSVIIPELFRISGKNPNATASASISFVSGIGFVGFLLGPVCLGFISKLFSLKASFGLLCLLVALAAFLSIRGVRRL